MKKMLAFCEKILFGFIFSNIFISICAAAQVLLSCILFKIPVQSHVLIFVVICTFGMYNFSILLSKPKNQKESVFLRSNWIFHHYWLMIMSTLIAFGFAGYIYLFQFNSASQIVMLVSGIISLLYNIPLIPKEGKKVGLRNLPIIKVLLIALVWALSCSLLPVLEAGNQGIKISTIILLSINNFLFITAITIPFDIRDLYQDTYYHMKTIPTLIGAKKSYYLCALLLLLYTLIFLFAFPVINGLSIGIISSIILTAVLIFHPSIKKGPFYYFFCLDGTMLVQYLLVYLLF